MPYFYYGYLSGDSLYSLSIMLLLIGVILSFIAQAKVNGNFKKYSQVGCAINGAQAARRLLELNGVSGVSIVKCQGNLTDRFDPRNNTIYLSENVYDTYSIAAVGIACHEAGHAVQYASGYAPLKLRNAIIPVTKFGSSLAMPLVLLGLVFSFYPLALLGVLFFGASLFFQLVTLPVEFNASSRAIDTIRNSFILTDEKEISFVRKVLTSAALTYVASAVSSLLQLLRLVLISRRNSRD